MSWRTFNMNWLNAWVKHWPVEPVCWLGNRIQATLLNPDMCNPDFCLNRTDWKVPVTSYTYHFYTHNPDFA